MAEPVYAPVIFTAKTLFKALGLRIRIRGAEHMPRHGGAVLASNHISYLDFIFAGLGANPAGRYVRFMAKDTIWSNPVAGPLMRGMKHIPVDRAAGAASLAAGLASVRRGEVVGVFPEATISQSFELKTFKNGAARMAADAGVPLVPVVLWGTQRMMTKGRPRDFSRGKAISVTVGEPFHPVPADDMNQTTAALRARMADMLDDAVATYPQRPAGEADRWWLPARHGGTAPTPQEAAALEVAERKARAARATDRS
ncbi:MAG TPA: lysophospholipid acyltransferase family protein [Candidatus Nanopelagicales bacterium]|nr:lysophospholipid acyltransferase family protein [Candidatus Nanopelagicales bacterium]